MNIDLMQLNFVDQELKFIVKHLEQVLKVKFTITSIYRIGDSGVHGTLPVRGIDLRCSYDPFGKFIENFINTRWMYDTERPSKNCCTYHDVGKGKHIHIQTHANTIRRQDG